MSNSIICPSCGAHIELEKTSYESIIKQVRDSEYKSDLEKIEERCNKDKESAVKLSKAEMESEYQNKINEKELEINSLKAKLDSIEAENKLKINEAVTEKEREVNVEKEKVFQLQSKIETAEKERILSENNIKDTYEKQLKDKDEMIAHYKDLKAKQSTKMVGETLEQHCEIEFNKWRATAFQKAYFEKDNEVISGSKGDYVYRDYAVDGTEYISIMFEMKNEMETTEKKHKNSDFFKKLDQDRKNKNCEFAVLVSLLEEDSDLYNQGIVDVSYEYEKMYVIRPQFFIPLITMLRNAALNSLSYKQELAVLRNQEIDITNFENNVNVFKEGFLKNYESYQTNHEKAIKAIDDVIKKLESIKSSFKTSENQLRLANNKAQELSIKKLTKNSPTMAEKFDQSKK